MDDQLPNFAQQFDPSLWKKLSPRRLEHRVYLPTAITFHRLAPVTSRTPRSHHKLAPHPYKHLDPEEIARAQAKARHALLKARLSKDGAVEPGPSTSHESGKDKYYQENHLSEKKNEGSKNIKQPNGKTGKLKDTEKIKPPKSDPVPGQPSSRPKLPIYRGIGETNLRIRQITKLTSMIVDCVQDLDSIPKRPTMKRDFISPHEIDVKKKRWNEFLHSSGRMLFTLKREVSLIERAIKHEEKSDKFLRMLASSTRTLYKLLLAMKTYSEAAFQSPHGKKLYGELNEVCHRLFAVTSAFGISPPKQKLKLPAEMVESETEDSSIDSSELPTSDVNASNLNVLQPEYVRNRLFQIANEKLQKKRRKKQRNGHAVSTSKGRAKEKSEIILSPLKYTSKIESPSPLQDPLQSQHTMPMKTNCHGHKVTFIDDSERNGNTCREEQTLCSSAGEAVAGGRNHFGKTRDKTSTSSENLMYSEGMTVQEIKSLQQPAVVCKMQDHNRLVEETANAVVSRLIPFIGQDVEEKHKGEPNLEEPSSTEHLEKDSLLVRDISHQIQFMLERVCKIEEEREQSLDVLMEVSRRIEKKVVYPESTLQTAINQAQTVLNNLAQKENRIASFDTYVKFPATSINVHDSQGKVIQNVKDPSLVTFMKSGSVGSDEMSIFKDDSLLENSGFADERFPVPISENIADQIKFLKEEFWASLVQRGFAKPVEVADDGTTAAKEAVELMLKQKFATNAVTFKENLTENRTDIGKQKAILKKTSSTTNAKRDLAQSKVTKEDKATLVTSLLSSYSNSFETESGEQTRTSTELSDKNESRKTSDECSSRSKVTNSDVLSSRTEENDSESSGANSESATFPSYDGGSI